VLAREIEHHMEQTQRFVRALMNTINDPKLETCVADLHDAVLPVLDLLNEHEGELYHQGLIAGQMR
jgi:hypothetical protein